MGDFYISFRRNKLDDFAWEAPQPISSLNTSADEFGPWGFEEEGTDKLTLFLNSNRPGGPGGYDIYSSILLPDGTFSTPALVQELSSSANDTFPVVRRDGLELFLISNRTAADAVGGLDVWVSTRASTSAPWSTPVNLGPTVNSTANENRAAISFDGTYMIFHSNRPGGSGGFDLYETRRRRVRGRIEAAQHFVRLHYLDFLKREPDEGGWAFWASQILQCGDDARCIDRKQVDVSRAFFYSGEFIAREPRLAENLRGTRTYNEAFVEWSYRTYLQREPDPVGFNFWVGKLNDRIPNLTDADYSEMIHAFIVSAEYQARLNQ